MPRAGGLKGQFAGLCSLLDFQGSGGSSRLRAKFRALAPPPMPESVTVGTSWVTGRTFLESDTGQDLAQAWAPPPAPGAGVPSFCGTVR